jgi:hypothetical protein
VNAKSARWLYQDDGPDPEPLDPEPLKCNAETTPWGTLDHYDCDPMTCTAIAFDIFDECHDWQNGLNR